MVFNRFERVPERPLFAVIDREHGAGILLDAIHQGVPERHARWAELDQSQTICFFFRYSLETARHEHVTRRCRPRRKNHLQIAPRGAARFPTNVFAILCD